MTATAAQAQAFVAQCRFGVNIERNNLYNMGGNLIAYIPKLAALKLFVRSFCAYSPTENFSVSSVLPKPPTEADMARFWVPIHAMIAAKVPVIFECCDGLQLSDFASNQAMITDHIGNLGRWIAAEGFDPSLFVCGPINECQGGSDALWEPLRAPLMTALRGELPDTVLIKSAHNWGYYGDGGNSPGLTDGTYTVGPDPAVIHSFHCYDALNQNILPGHWTWVFGTRIAPWAAAHGVTGQVLSGETGFAGPNWGDSSAFNPNATTGWPAVIAAWSANAGAGVPVTMWAITDGSGFPMNLSGSDPTIHPELVTALEAAEGAAATPPPPAPPVQPPSPPAPPAAVSALSGLAARVDPTGIFLVVTKAKGSNWTMQYSLDGKYVGTLEDSAPDGTMHYMVALPPPGLHSIVVNLIGSPADIDGVSFTVPPATVVAPPPPPPPTALTAKQEATAALADLQAAAASLAAALTALGSALALM